MGHDRGLRLTAQALQALVQALDVTQVDIADIGHKVSDIAARVGHLLDNVVVAKDRVDLSQDTGTVGVDEDDTDVVLLGGSERSQGDLGHVHGTQSASLVDVPDKRIGDLDTNGTLSLCGELSENHLSKRLWVKRTLGASTDVGGKDQVLE
jgi:hypothetical protein